MQAHACYRHQQPAWHAAGVLINAIFPTWLITAILIPFLTYLAFRTTRTALRLHRIEEAVRNEAAQLGSTVVSYPSALNAVTGPSIERFPTRLLSALPSSFISDLGPAISGFQPRSLSMAMARVNSATAASPASPTSLRHPHPLDSVAEEDTESLSIVRPALAVRAQTAHPRLGEGLPRFWAQQAAATLDVAERGLAACPNHAALPPAASSRLSDDEDLDAQMPFTMFAGVPLPAGADSTSSLTQTARGDSAMDVQDGAQSKEEDSQAEAGIAKVLPDVVATPKPLASTGGTAWQPDGMAAAKLAERADMGEAASGKLDSLHSKSLPNLSLAARSLPQTVSSPFGVAPVASPVRPTEATEMAPLRHACMLLCCQFNRMPDYERHLQLLSFTQACTSVICMHSNMS